jgi:hypothetical protein
MAPSAVEAVDINFVADEAVVVILEETVKNNA